MDIRNLPTGVAHTGIHHHDPVGESAQSAAKPMAAHDAKTASGVLRDRLELSGTGQGPHIPEEHRELMMVGRKALMNAPPLSQERADAIRERIQNGHYSQPDVVDQIAHQLESVLQGGPDRFPPLTQDH